MLRCGPGVFFSGMEIPQLYLLSQLTLQELSVHCYQESLTRRAGTNAIENSHKRYLYRYAGRSPELVLTLSGLSEKIIMDLPVAEENGGEGARNVQKKSPQSEGRGERPEC